MASNLAFNILVDLDGKKAAAEVDEIRAKLDELGGKTVGVNIDTAAAKVELDELKARLTEIASKHPTVEARVDATRALEKLAELEAAARTLNGKRIDLNVDDKGSADKSKNDINALLLAGLALGPAIIPVAGAVAGALAAIGTGAVIGAAAVGVLALGFHGIGAGVTELGNAQIANAGKAQAAAAQQISSANSIANAQDALKNAVENVSVAQESAAASVHSALEQLTAAHLAVQSAVRQEATAEQTLADDQHAATIAQRNLTQARVDAQRALQDMSFSVTDNALAQKRAQIDLQAALVAQRNIAGTDPRRAGADLSVAEQQQRLIELQTQGQRLAQDKTAADAKGVEGSTQVTSAQDALHTALERVAAAQQSVANSAAAIVQAQVKEGDAAVAVARAQESGARSVAAAQQSVVTATRALEGAQASAAAQTAAQAAQTANLNKAMDALSPSGQQFAHFINDDLKPKIKELQATAQAGLLPGVEQGLKNMMPLMPEIKGLVGDISHTLGDMVANIGAALNNPFWRGFIGFIRGEASPSIRTFGDIMGNLSTAGAAILMAFKPVWDQMGAGLDSWSAKFAAASKSLGSNQQFQNFLKFVHDEGPLVMHTLGDLVVILVKVGEALAPWGGGVLAILDGMSRLINILPQGVLDWLAPTILAITIAMKSWGTIMAVLNTVMPILTGEVWAVNGAMLANPIGIVILALTALTVGVIYCYNHFQIFRDIISVGWNVIKDVSLFVGGGLRLEFNRLVSGLEAIGRAFGGVVNWVRDNWGAIANLARIPIQFVVDVVYNNGILPVWNGIAGVFGLHQLAPVHMAEGGILPGYAPGRDTVPAMLSPGEGILVPEAVKGLGPGFVGWANKTFSAGRVTGGSGYADGGIVGDVTGVFTDPLGTLKRLFGGPLNDAAHTPGTGDLTHAIAGLPMAVINAAVDKAKSLITSMASAGMGDFGGGAGVDRWSGITLAALAQMGQPGSLLATTLRRMNQESGGNPTAVNRSDINWQHGTPSVGLMQVIGPTYAANKVIDRGPYMYGVSVDPLSNILSSMHYAIGRYGSLASAYNRAGGYADGGIVTAPTIAHVGEAGAEAIIPLNRPGRAHSVMAAAGLGGHTINVGPVHVSQGVDVDLLASRLAFSAATAGL